MNVRKELKKKASDRNRINQLPLTDYSSLIKREFSSISFFFLHNSLLACRFIYIFIFSLFSLLTRRQKFPSMASFPFLNSQIEKRGDAIKTADHQLFHSSSSHSLFILFGDFLIILLIFVFLSFQFNSSTPYFFKKSIS
jgi:hypothetical protein